MIDSPIFCQEYQLVKGRGCFSSLTLHITQQRIHNNNMGGLLGMWSHESSHVRLCNYQLNQVDDLSF